MKRSFLLTDSIHVDAPIERCFLLSTHVQIVEEVLGMHPVAGRITGHVREGDAILWKGWKFGIPQLHRSQIEAAQAPVFFRDRMIEGRFAWFEHDHEFIAQQPGTVLLRDEVRFAMPLGAPGACVGRFLLVPHIRGLMRQRFARIKQLAESNDWQRYLADSVNS